MQLLTAEQLASMPQADVLDLINTLATSKHFQVFTAEALDYKLANTFTSDMLYIYFDIDGLKQHNNVKGLAGTSAMVREGLSGRVNDIIGCAFSGDELIAVVASHDAVGYATRMLEQFRDNGFTATIAIAYDIDTAKQWVECLKGINSRNCVFSAISGMFVCAD